MKSHRTNCGQLVPLEDRMNKQELEKRAAKIEARRTFAQQISVEHAKTRGIAVVAYSVVQRSFWGRFKWLILGK